jgi:glycosyltransferase involved in cell wall biosynthesis
VRSARQFVNTETDPCHDVEIALRILLSSHRYHPDIGGIETVSRLLAREFGRAGHEVAVITDTGSSIQRDVEPTIERTPSAGRVAKRVRWCQVYFQNNISLRAAWPLILSRRPWVVTTQTWLRGPNGAADWNDRVKRWALKRATNVYISQAVAAHVGLRGIVVPNPYDTEVFRLRSDCARDRQLVFVGRLVSDKGVDVLLSALALLAAAGVRPTLTIIGGGSEETRLRAMVSDLHLTKQVEFAGPVQGEELARWLNRHQVMVVPSRWAEPFGVVALEGIACGCAVVGSADGGLPDAIGPCGLTFPNGSSDSLASALSELLSHGRGKSSELLSSAQSHLAKHAPETIARRYLDLFAIATDSRSHDRRRPSHR